jgi:transposase
VLLPRQQAKLARGTKDKEHAMSQTPNTTIAVIGIDIGKNSFHVVGHDARGATVMGPASANLHMSRHIDMQRTGN